VARYAAKKDAFEQFSAMKYDELSADMEMVAANTAQAPVRL
jgi:hypothetical protein